MCRSSWSFTFFGVLFLFPFSVKAQLIPFGFVANQTKPPPSFIASSSSVTGITTTRTQVVKPAGLAVGDLMVVWLGKDNTSAVTTPAGWSSDESVAVTGYGMYMFSKVADASDVAASSFSFTWASGASTSDRHAIIAHFRGVNGATPVTDTTSTTGSGSTMTYLGATTVSPNSVILVVGGSYSMPSTPSGFTSRNADGWATRMSSKVQGSVGASGNFTSTSDTAWGSFLMIISP